MKMKLQELNTNYTFLRPVHPDLRVVERVFCVLFEYKLNYNSSFDF